LRPPTREEIRRKALELWYKYYAPKTGSYTTPSEEELKELGLWHEAQLELMRSEASRLEQMIERATAEDIEQLYSAIEEMMNRLDQLEEEIRRLRQQQEKKRETEEWEKPLLALEQQVTWLESEDKISPEEAQQLYMMIRRARELDGRNREAYKMLVRDIRSLIEHYRERSLERKKQAPRIQVATPYIPPPATLAPAVHVEREKRVYLRLKDGRVCFDEEAELDIEDHAPYGMIEYVRSCGYIYGTASYFPLDKYIELTPRMFRPITYWRWIADIIRYVRSHEQELRDKLLRGYTVYFRFPETTPVTGAGWT